MTTYFSLQLLLVHMITVNIFNEVGFMEMCLFVYYVNYLEYTLELY